MTSHPDDCSVMLDGNKELEFSPRSLQQYVIQTRLCNLKNLTVLPLLVSTGSEIAHFCLYMMYLEVMCVLPCKIDLAVEALLRVINKWF